MTRIINCRRCRRVLPEVSLGDYCAACLIACVSPVAAPAVEMREPLGEALARAVEDDGNILHGDIYDALIAYRARYPREWK